MNNYLSTKRENYEKLKSNENGRRTNMVKKLNKLKMEFNIKMSENNENISPEIKLIGESLNDYTNDLLNYYKKRYFNIKNEEKKKKIQILFKRKSYFGSFLIYGYSIIVWKFC